MAGAVPPSPRAEISVLLADASRMNNQLLSSALTRDRRFRVVEVAVTREGLVQAMSLRPDVTVVAADLETPGGGLQATETLVDSQPDARVVILLDELEQEKVVEAFRSGARAAFGRNEPVASLLKCISCVYQGQVWGSGRELRFLVQALKQSRRQANKFAKNDLSLLSGREQEVVRWVCEGLNNREIAHRMQLSEHTIKNHLFRIFAKLGVSSRIEIMFSALSGALESLPKTAADPASDSERFHLYLQQAEHSATAKLALARMYLEGLGIEKDVAAGCRWLNLAQLEAHEIMEECSTLAALIEPAERPQAARVSGERLQLCELSQRQDPSEPDLQKSPRQRRSGMHRKTATLTSAASAPDNP